MEKRLNFLKQNYVKMTQNIKFCFCISIAVTSAPI